MQARQSHCCEAKALPSTTARLLLMAQQLITDHLNYQFSLTKIFDDTMTAVNGRLRQPSWRFRGTRPEADNGQTSKNADLPEAEDAAHEGLNCTSLVTYTDTYPIRSPQVLPLIILTGLPITH